MTAGSGSRDVHVTHIDAGARRGGHLTAYLAIGSLLAVLWVSWFVVARGGQPTDGTRITGALYPASEWHDGTELHTVLDAEAVQLRKGDRVVSVDGRPLAAWVGEASDRDFRVGEQLTYGVLRGGAETLVVVTLRPYPWGAALPHNSAMLILEAALLVVAAGVASRRPLDPAGRVVLAIAVVLPFGFPDWPVRAQVLDLARSPWPLWPQIAAAGVWAVVWGAMIPHFALVFPAAPSVVARHRGVIPVLYAVPLVLYALYMAVTLPRARDSLEALERISTAALIPQRVAPLVVIGLTAWAYLRTSDVDQRRRVTLVAASVVAAFGLNFVIAQLPELLLGRSLVAYPYNTWIFLICPAAIGLAILRHRLFDITVVLRKSMIAVAVAIALIAALVLVAWAVGRPTPSELPVVLVGVGATLTAAGAYRRLRFHAYRRLYGARGDPYDVVEQIDELQSGSDPQAVLRQLAETLTRALHLPYAAITVVDQGTTVHASSGSPEREPVSVRLMRDDEDVGWVDLDVGVGREPFGDADAQLLRAIATHAASSVRAAIQNRDLQQARARLVTSREDERRRVRHDLHDGVAPTLAILAMNLEVAKDMIQANPTGAADALDSAARRANEAMVEIRRTVQNLKPTVLDEVGLAGAVRLLADRTTHAHSGAQVPDLTVTVDATGNLENLPAAVEVAAYRIVSEAVHNASRHSRAAVCGIHLERHGQMLSVRVEDDGDGIAPDVKGGTGMASMCERATELGGHAHIRRLSASGGTIVSASIPVTTIGNAT